ncbi:tail fiber assembly protein [Erwinia papayae]|uniref:Tail fiber assembly protein n=1 Tax=Erwinia papayae TaxID=206499 RepID=A0ABV3N384_9GAMM
MPKNMYSLKTLGFYPADEENQKPYVDAGTLPDDLQPISDDDYTAFFNPPDGYYGLFDKTGPHLEKNPEPDPAIENLQKAQTKYDSASEHITALQQRMDDDDYDDINTEEAVKAQKATWTSYRKALRAYIAAGDGTVILPAAPTEAGS